MKHLQELFDKAGGSALFAYDLNLHQYTVERWVRHGIPYKYFGALSKKYGVTLSQLDAFNRAVKAQRATRGS